MNRKNTIKSLNTVICITINHQLKFHDNESHKNTSHFNISLELEVSSNTFIVLLDFKSFPQFVLIYFLQNLV